MHSTDHSDIVEAADSRRLHKWVLPIGDILLLCIVLVSVWGDVSRILGFNPHPFPHLMVNYNDPTVVQADFRECDF